MRRRITPSAALLNASERFLVQLHAHDILVHTSRWPQTGRTTLDTIGRLRIGAAKRAITDVAELGRLEAGKVFQVATGVAGEDLAGDDPHLKIALNGEAAKYTRPLDEARDWFRAESGLAGTDMELARHAVSVVVKGMAAEQAAGPVLG